MAAPRESDQERPVILLFRHDLRLEDNRALHAAAETGKPCIAVFVLDEESPGAVRLGGARRWWLHHSLAALSAGLAGVGARLALRRGEMAEVADAVVGETGADLVLWNRRYDQPGIAADEAMRARLAASAVASDSLDGQLLHDPASLTTSTGGPYKVYSAFWRALAASGEPRDPVPAPKRIRAFSGAVQSDRLDDWALLPRSPDWAGGLRQEWRPGEAGAGERLRQFLEGALRGYREGRDRPDLQGTSRLSPHLAHGEITPFQIWRAVAAAGGSGDAEKFRQEIGWREFSWHLLHHNPALATKNFNAGFDGFEWTNDAELLKAWQRGRTGYPVVDAGMRQLWQTGWMHNRVRMIAASFLIKHLRIDWRIGQEWFHDTLVDADPANNASGWQWVAGSGADAAPYFRIFNPVLQGEKYDPRGDYVRRYVPELAGLPDAFIQHPWDTPGHVLRQAGVKLGADYPVPIVDHAAARNRALAAFKRLRG